MLFVKPKFLNMKNIYFLIIALLISTASIGQENKAEKKEPIVKFSGHIRYEAYFDSYESVTSREDDIYLYPVRQNLNADGDDINKYGQLNMLSAQSRLRAKINGPEAFGAKVKGIVEVDFLGKTGGFEQTPRIRHMAMTLNWTKAKVTMGQTWHPVFATECFPQVLSMGAALPFNPLNRAPQIKVNYNITDVIEFTGAAISHLDMRSAGPTQAQNNAVVPDFHFALKYKTKSLAAGVIGGYKLLKPRTTTNTGAITKETIGSYDVAGFAKVKINELTLKAYGIYGQNLSSYVMIGGYGAAENPNGANAVDDYSYSNINTMSVWGEVIYNFGAVGVGAFAGYSSNLGSSETDFYTNTMYARGGNIDNILRISPRVTVTSGKIMFGLEYMMTSATYMDLAADKYEAAVDANGDELIDDAVTNNRIQFSAKYTF